MNHNHKHKTTQGRIEDVKRRWFVFDAAGKTLGRFCSEVVKVLRGRHRVDWTPHVDSGDGVIIINAEKITVTGNKEASKVYYSHTGYMSGLRETPFRIMKARNPDRILRRAIEGMMPRNRQTERQLTRLRIVAGESHEFEAQQPTAINL
jgi:large subunit ribosomal protein L13